MSDDEYMKRQVNRAIGYFLLIQAMFVLFLVGLVFAFKLIQHLIS